jgi:hypothetical protein
MWDSERIEVRGSEQVWLVRKREVKRRDDVVNLTQDDQPRSGELPRVLKLLRRGD